MKEFTLLFAIVAFSMIALAQETEVPEQLTDSTAITYDTVSQNYDTEIKYFDDPEFKEKAAILVRAFRVDKGTNTNPQLLSLKYYVKVFNTYVEVPIRFIWYSKKGEEWVKPELNY